MTNAILNIRQSLIGASFALLLPQTSMAQTAVPVTQSQDPNTPVSEVIDYTIKPLGVSKADGTLAAYKVSMNEATTLVSGQVKRQRYSMICNAGPGLGAEFVEAGGAGSQGCIGEAPNTSGVLPTPVKGKDCSVDAQETLDFTRTIKGPHGSAYPDTIAVSKTCGDITEGLYFNGPSGIKYVKASVRPDDAQTSFQRYGHLAADLTAN